MQVIRGIHNLGDDHRGCVVTLGNFDGVHHGHQLLIAHARAKAKELSAPSLLLTLEPQPREFFTDGQTPVPARLTRFREKASLLRDAGIDYLLCVPFNRLTADTGPSDIINDWLIRRLGVRYIVVGDDFRFGRNAAGDYEMLRAAGDKAGFGVSQLGTLSIDGERVSSTRVREVLAEANFELAEKLLGRPYSIGGRVVYGRQLGRELGVPTANVRLQRYQAALAGVYAVTVGGLEQAYKGVANIGVRPTVDGVEPLLEVHLFDFEGDLYGRFIEVTFRHKIRDEQTFDGLESLKAQIDADRVTAKALLADG